MANDPSDSITLAASKFHLVTPAISEVVRPSGSPVAAGPITGKTPELGGPSPAIRVAMYSSLDAAKAVRNEWTQLAGVLGTDLFGSFEWCETWWRHFSQGRRLEIHTFWATDELVAVFPLFRETLRWGPVSVRVLRVLGSDHAGTRCWPLFQTRFAEDVLRLLLESMNRTGRWDVLQIGDLPGYFPQVDVLCSALRSTQAGQVYCNRGYYPHAVFTLPGDFEQYLSKLSGNERNNIRKNDRRLSKSHQMKATVVPRDDIPTAIQELFQWHDEYWDSQNGIGFFSLWPGSREFHRDIGNLRGTSGEAVFIRVEADGQPIGLVYTRRFLGRLHLFQAVRAPGGLWESFGPGRLLHCETFRWCMSQSIATVDAMSGFYEYKRRLGAQFAGLTTLALVHSSFTSRMRAKLFRAAVSVVDAIYFRLWLSRITPLLRKRFRMKNNPLVRAGMNRRFIRSRFILAAMSNVKDKSVRQARVANQHDA